MNILIKQIEEEASICKFKPQWEKCLHLDHNISDPTIKYADSTPLPKQESAIYLGSTVADNASPKQETNHRIGIASYTMGKLNLFWKKVQMLQGMATTNT